MALLFQGMVCFIKHDGLKTGLFCHRKIQWKLKKTWKCWHCIEKSKKFVWKAKSVWFSVFQWKLKISQGKQPLLGKKFIELKTQFSVKNLLRSKNFDQPYSWAWLSKRLRTVGAEHSGRSGLILCSAEHVLRQHSSALITVSRSWRHLAPGWISPCLCVFRHLWKCSQVLKVFPA